MKKGTCNRSSYDQNRVSAKSHHASHNTHHANGISLISLIITIIVIIILAAIVIFTGLNTPDRANLAKFVQTFSDYNTAIMGDFTTKKTKYALSGLTRKDNQIYYTIATGNELDVNDVPPATGTVEDLGIDLHPEQLEGNDYYEITADSNIDKIQNQKQFYEATEKHYVTDKGEAFFLPGYLVQEGTTKRWYINERKYYESDTPVYKLSCDITYKIVTEANGNTEPTEKVVEGTKLYIKITGATIEGQTATVTPSGAFEVTKNGSYPFTLAATVEGRNVTKTASVKVDSFRTPLLSEKYHVGEFVDYSPEIKTYTTNTTNSDGNTGVANTDLTTTSGVKWKILSVDDEAKTILITAFGATNTDKEVTLSGATGYYKGPNELNNICAALYSNANSYASPVVARSLTIDDINKAYGYTPDYENARRYAYYPYGSGVSDTVEYKGKTYNKTSHGSTTYRFYKENGALIECENSTNTDYFTPTANKPVYVTSTFYSYNPSENETGRDSRVGGVLGSSNGWLASPCVDVNSSFADFYVRYAHSNYIDANSVVYSGGGTYTPARGLRPAISLSSELFTGEGTGEDGNGWKLQAKN